MELVVVLMLFALVEAAAFFGGRDSRDGNDWARHSRL
jgi:hypothetical protein